MQLDFSLNILEAVTFSNYSAIYACQLQSEITLFLQLNEKQVLGYKLVVILYPITLSWVIKMISLISLIN